MKSKKWGKVKGNVVGKCKVCGKEMLKNTQDQWYYDGVNTFVCKHHPGAKKWFDTVNFCRTREEWEEKKKEK